MRHEIKHPRGRRHRSAPAPRNETPATFTMKKEIMMMNRRTFSTALLAGAATSLISARGTAANAVQPKARNVVLVHGLFADGSCWSEVIARLQAGGLNVTSVQNPLTTLPEAVASAVRVLARQDGPTVLVGHCFSGMIVTGKTTNAAWRSKPSYYAVSTEDRTINPDLERFMAKRMGAKTIEVKASHLSLISQPDEIAQLIREAAGQRGAVRRGRAFK
jgi:pimeloyl-ACP methyl ester carboxylesterase